MKNEPTERRRYSETNETKKTHTGTIHESVRVRVTLCCQTSGLISTPPHTQGFDLIDFHQTSHHLLPPFSSPLRLVSEKHTPYSAPKCPQPRNGVKIISMRGTVCATHHCYEPTYVFPSNRPNVRLFLVCVFSLHFKPFPTVFSTPVCTHIHVQHFWGSFNRHSAAVAAEISL